MTQGSSSLELTHSIARYAREYAIIVLLILLLIVLAIASPAFFTTANLVNILSQSTPLAIIAAAGTYVIVSGNFDLSTGSIFSVGSVCAAWVTTSTGSVGMGLGSALAIGLVLGVLNGIVVTTLKIHSFLATLASSLVFNAVAVLITGGALIVVSEEAFTTLGRGRLFGVFLSVYLLVAVSALLWVVLSKSVFGRHVFAVGGNSEAAELSGIRVDRIKVGVFALSGLASGIAAAVAVSRIASGQPQAGLGLELEAIAAVILGGTSIYGGVGAVWRSVAGVFLIALIGNGFDVMGFNPQLKSLVTGVVILAAVALAATGRPKR